MIKAMSRKTTALVALLLFLGGLALRLPSLGSFLTPDERYWSQGTSQFVTALQHREWSDTYAYGHPGVTVTWAGALSLALRTMIAPPADAADLTSLTIALAQEPNRSDMIAWFRFPIAVMCVLGIVVIFLLLRRIVSWPAALLAAALISLDPFLLANSRILHLDALLTLTLTIAWLALLAATRSQKRSLYVLSGVALGLAFLTKTPALLTTPIVMAWVVGHRCHGRRQRDDGATQGAVIPIITDLVWIGLPAVLVVFLLWPALWVNPIGTLRRMLLFSAGMGGVGHELGNYWLGRPVAAPGALFYGAVLLWRSTPVSLMGLLLALAALLKALPWPGSPPGNGRRQGWGMVLFVVWFALIMSLGAKKFDRYLLPVFPMVDILAAAGWTAFAGWLAHRKRWSVAQTITAVSVLLVGLQATQVVLNLPTYLTAYNPLLGGIRTARQVMLVGWGEGLETAASFLNEQPNADQTRVASWYGHNVFGPFFAGQSFDLQYDLATADALFANDVSFVVTYLNQTQRDLPDESIRNYLEEPVSVVANWGVPLAQVYAWPKPFAHTTDQTLAAGLHLLGWEVGHRDPTNGHLPVTLYWDAAQVKSRPDDVPPMTVWIKDAAGEVWATAEDELTLDADNLVPGWSQRPALRQTLELRTPVGLAAGRYPIEIAPLNGDILALETIDISPTLASEATGSGDATRLPEDVLFDGAMALVGYDLQAQGQDWQLDLLWLAQQQPSPAQFFVHVVDADDRIIAQHDGVLAALPGQQAQWQAGELARQRVRLELPPEVNADDLRVYVGLYLSPSGQRLPLTVDGRAVPGGRYNLLQQ